jgi:hypothetical protein
MDGRDSGRAGAASEGGGEGIFTGIIHTRAALVLRLPTVYDRPNWSSTTGFRLPRASAAALSSFSNIFNTFSIRASSSVACAVFAIDRYSSSFVRLVIARRYRELVSGPSNAAHLYPALPYGPAGLKYSTGESRQRKERKSGKSGLGVVGYLLEVSQRVVVARLAGAERRGVGLGALRTTRGAINITENAGGAYAAVVCSDRTSASSRGGTTATGNERGSRLSLVLRAH